MIPAIQLISKPSTSRPGVWLIQKLNDLKDLPFSPEEFNYVRKKNQKDEKDIVEFDQLGKLRIIVFLKSGKDKDWRLEQARLQGEKLRIILKNHNCKEVQIIHKGNQKAESLAIAEGLVLGSYMFLKYKTDKEGVSTAVSTVYAAINGLSSEEIHRINNTLLSTAWARDLVNEPLSYLTAEKLAEDVKEKMQQAGVSVEVLNKKRIQALKMGGLLAVNKGSVDPPTFSILEWKPENAVNSQPIILVGKGVVYDTGGLSLKPSNYMDTMKCDMSGAAAVAATCRAVALNKLPVHLIVLIPATDNRPDGNAYVPGDVITMYDGTTVEVLNTDAEGRMILADALAYAQKFKPQLVIDVATLTGSAQRALGKYGIVGMQKLAKSGMLDLQKSGERTGERVVEFPLWDEYAESIKSDIADVKNIGGAEAGAITAGKFLERFTDYPYIHLDIAGTAFAEKRFNYRGQGGTGSTVRLLYHFLENIASTVKA